MKKHYVAIRNNKPTYIGAHGLKPRDAICEIQSPLIGKCFKLVFLNDKYIAVLDEVEEAKRLANDI